MSVNTRSGETGHPAHAHGSTFVTVGESMRSSMVTPVLPQLQDPRGHIAVAPYIRTIGSPFNSQPDDTTQGDSCTYASAVSQRNSTMC